ncbi:MAG: hypothetical protein FWG88_02500 [Oscillospiraceae bacterium]|nr:hypothetical protein [Oscillospiraceae bacterium]
MSVTKPRRFLEWIKTVVIVGLLASALFLGNATGLFNDFFATIPLVASITANRRNSGAATTDSDGTHFIEASRPSAIVITLANGERYGLKYDIAMRNLIYDRTSSILGEALGSAALPREVEESTWREALLLPGVYYEYNYPIKLSILGSWLGAVVSDEIGDVSLRRVFVAFGNDRSSVYFQDAENGLFYSSETASSATKAQDIENYNENGTYFAYETNIYAASVAPYMLIFQGNNHPDIRASTIGSADEQLDYVLDILGYSGDTYLPYTIADVLVRAGAQYNIRADGQGCLFFRRTDFAPLNDEERLNGELAIIEKARSLIAETIGNMGSGAEVFLEYMEYGNQDMLTLYFAYYIAGGRIHVYEDGYAGKLTFTDGILTEMELRFRSYSLSGAYTSLAPERQIFAAAKSEFTLCYIDTGADRIQPMWTAFNEQ